MGVENAIFTYGGELGDYADLQGRRHHQLAEKRRGARDAYRELYKFTPPNWGKAFFVEDNQAITEGLAAMSMNYFAFFPALANEATNPHADEHRLLRQSGRARRRPASRRSAARASRSSPTRRTRTRRSSSSSGSSRTTSRRSGPSSAATPAARRCWSRTSSATPRRTTRPSTRPMFMVKDFWAVPEYAELLTQMNNRIYPLHRRAARAPPRKRSTGSPQDWDATLQEVRPQLVSGQRRLAGGGHRLRRPSRMTRQEGGGRGALWRRSIRIRGRRRAAGATSPSAISSSFRRSLFLIIFNIFPLIYSLGYSFTDFRASVNEPAELRRPAELPRAARPTRTSGTTSRSPRST